MNRKLKMNLVVFLLLEIVFFAVGAWFFGKNEQLLREIIKEKKTSRNLELKILGYDKIESEYAKLAEEEEVIWRFASKDSPVSFIKEIEKAAIESETDLEIEIYKPTISSKKDKEKQEKQEKEGTVPLAFVLNTKGAFNSFVKFLVKLENLSKYASLKSINLEKQTVKANKDAPAEEYLAGEIIIFAK
ncbi:MAG: hypothetical protein U9Q72_03010 [Patescibacteria group bacterium]|nr:hypothetical protein [Patescibacteria group bacterium]